MNLSTGKLATMIRSTTVIAVRRDGKTAVAADGHPNVQSSRRSEDCAGVDLQTWEEAVSQVSSEVWPQVQRNDLRERWSV